MTNDPEETRRLGAKIGELLRPGDVVLLRGGLGSGKTTLVQGLAYGLGIREPVTSPTFTLVHEYRGLVPLIHLDPYRLENPVEVAALGFDELLERPAALVVEWSERLGEVAPAERLEIDMETIAESIRRITLTAVGGHYEHVVLDMGPPSC